MAIQELGQQGHAGHVREVRAHAAGGEDHGGRVGESVHQRADEPVDGAIDGSQPLPGRARRGQAMERVRLVHAVPQALDRGMQLARDHHREVPLGQALAEEPARALRPHFGRAREQLTHLPAALGRGPGEAVDPILCWIRAEARLELGEQLGGPRAGPGAGVVRSPVHDSFDRRCLREIEVRRVEDHRADIDAAREGRETRALLPDRVARRVEVHRRPAAAGLRREPRAHVLPREPRTLCRPVLQEKARAPAPQRRKRRQLPGRHEPVAEGRLVPVEADRKHSLCGHWRILRVASVYRNEEPE